MVMFPFSPVLSLGSAFRRRLKDEEEELRRLERSLPLALGRPGSSGFTVMSEGLLSLLALVTKLNRAVSSLVIVALPSLETKRRYSHILVSADYRDVIGNVRVAGVRCKGVCRWGREGGGSCDRGMYSIYTVVWYGEV